MNAVKHPFHYLAMAVHTLLQKKLYEQVKASHLTLGQPKILDYLKDHDGVSQKEIAAGCFMEAGSLTSVLNRMEEKHLIERRILNGNRRTYHIFLTEYGKKQQQLVEQHFILLEEQAFAGISASQKADFLDTFTKIYENLALRPNPTDQTPGHDSKQKE